MNAEQIAKLKEVALKAPKNPGEWPFYLRSFQAAASPAVILELIALAERALLAAAPAPIQQGQLVEVGQMIEFDDHEDPRFHTIICDWDNEARAKLTAGTKIYAASAGSQVQAAGDARKLNWGEVSRPSKEIGYDHVIAQTPFGRVLITWKGWKDYPSFEIEDHPLEIVRNWCGSSLESAKEEAERAYFEAIDAAMREQP